MAHETILPAIKALLISDGVGADHAERIAMVIQSDEQGYIPIRVAARALGISARTAWTRARAHGVPTISRRGRAGSLVDFHGLRNASRATASLTSTP